MSENAIWLLNKFLFIPYLIVGSPLYWSATLNAAGGHTHAQRVDSLSDRAGLARIARRSLANP
uniref:hypothetical protein n=1 Tax=Pseudomonas sp. SST3 TaxID=2267882 RepID=UPI001F50E99F